MKTPQDLILNLRQVFGAKGSIDRLLVKKLGSNPRIKTLFIPERKITYLDRYVKKMIIAKKLPQQVKKNIVFLKTMRSYIGVRHKAGLPVRGQRTQTNAKTVKRRRSKSKNL